MKIVNALLFGYLILFPFGQLTRLPLSLAGAPEIHVYLIDLIVAGLVGSWLGWKLVKRSKFILPPLAKPIFFFSLIAFLSLVFNAPLLTNREVVVSSLYLFRWMAYAGIYFVIIDVRKYFNELKWDSISRYLLVVGVAVAVFGLIQYVLWPDLRPLETLAWDPHFYRVVSTFLDPGFTGLILVLTLILLIIIYWQKFLKKKSLFTLHYSLFTILYIALALTYSRSSYLAYFVGMGVIAWRKKALKFFLTVLLLGIVTLLVLPRPAGEGGKLGRTYSIEARIENWKHALIIARYHPLVGVGFNAYRFAQKDYGFLEKDEWQVTHAGAGADSSLLFVFATTGILGLFAYLWLWLRILQTKKLIILASAVALLTHSLFLNSLFYPWVMAWMWILVGELENR